MRGLFDRETAKKAQFNNATLSGIKFGQTIQSIVQDYQIQAIALSRTETVIHRYPVAGIAFRGPTPLSLLHENLSHELRGDRDEVRPVLKLMPVLLQQAEISFMHQSGALSVWSGRSCRK